MRHLCNQRILIILKGGVWLLKLGMDMCSTSDKWNQRVNLVGRFTRGPFLPIIERTGSAGTRFTL